MESKISLHRGTQNSYLIDIDELLDDNRISFLVDKTVKRDYYYTDFISEAHVVLSKKKYSINVKENIESRQEETVPINEMTAKEIRAGADVARIQRSKDKRIVCKFLGVTNARGWIKFDVTSQYTPGKHYAVHIKLKEANSLKYFKEFRKQDIIRLFLTGDIQLNCSCPDFRYRMKYQAWQMGYGLYKELRFPHIVNPRLTGSVCKHCLAVLRVLNFNYTAIAKAMSNSKFFKKKMEDKEYQNDLDKKISKTRRSKGKK